MLTINRKGLTWGQWLAALGTPEATSMTHLGRQRQAWQNGYSAEMYLADRRLRTEQYVRERRQESPPGSVGWLMATVKHGPYVDGGYPAYWVASCGETLCYKEVCEHILQYGRAARAHGRGYDRSDRDCARFYSESEYPTIFAHGVNWEDPELYCSATGQRIESAYAEHEATCRPGEDDPDSQLAEVNADIDADRHFASEQCDWHAQGNEGACACAYCERDDQ